MNLLPQEPQEFFCPLDGERLSKSKWEWCGNTLLSCSAGHVWEASWSRVWGHRLEFDVIKMVRCECGQLCPERNMKHASYEPVPQLIDLPQEKTRPKAVKRKERKICPDCFEIVKKAWSPDPEQSYARLVITPIKRGEEISFQYEEAVKIEPYPNPYGCGGCWGGGTEKTEAQVEQLIADFKRWNDQWVKLGVKLEVIRKPEMTVPEYINERKADHIAEHPEEAKDAQLQLV